MHFLHVGTMCASHGNVSIIFLAEVLYRLLLIFSYQVNAWLFFSSSWNPSIRTPL